MSTAFLVKVDSKTPGTPEYFIVTNCHAVMHGIQNGLNAIQVKMKQDTRQYVFDGEVLMMNKYVDLALIRPSKELIENFGQYAYPMSSLAVPQPGKISLVVFNFNV